MIKSWKPSETKRYERAGAVVLNQVRLGQAPISLRKSKWLQRGLWVLVAVAVVAGSLALWLTWDSRFYVYGAEIEGTRRISPAEIFRGSGLDGLHILWARSATIEARLLDEFPSLESAEVRCQLPATCGIRVTERQPRVLWQDQENVWWIDEEGAIFLAEDGAPVLEPAEGVSGRWAVTGSLPRGDDGNLDEPVRVALTELWAGGRDVPTVFDYTPDRGLSFVDQHGWRVFVGRGSGMDERLRALERLTDHLRSQGMAPEFVDVRFPRAPYYSVSPE